MRLRTIGLIAAFVLGLLVGPLPAGAQPGKMHRIGFLSVFSDSHSGSMRWQEAFRQGLRNHGWVEGKNISIEHRWMAGKRKRLPELADQLIRLNVEVVVVHGGASARAVQRLSKTMPIVMAETSDAVGRGVVQSLARPGGNITGLTSSNAELSEKRLELLKTIVPNLSRVAVLWTPKSPASKHAWQQTQLPAQQLGIQLHSMEVRSAGDFEKAFEDAVRAGAGALAGTPGVAPTFDEQRISDLG